MRLERALPLGGVVGATEIIDCVRPHPSRWYAPEHFAFVLANSREMPFIPWRGGLSLRTAPPELLELCGLSNGHPVSSAV